MNINRNGTLVLLAALALALSGCDDPPTRSGASTDPVVLTSVFGQGPGGVGADVLEALASDTAGAAVSVAAPRESTGTADAEADAVAALQAGDLDVTVVRADVLATAGADSLAVLQAPFLVTSPEQADRVVADPVAQDLMAGLDEIGLVGLAMVPGGLRHPFGYAGPLLVPDDYAGHGFNVHPGDGAAAIVDALGATPDTSIDTERAVAAARGDLVGIEVSLQHVQAVDLPAVLTSNVTLYTKFDVVIVRADAWAGLSRAQQEELRDAAVAAGARAVSERDTEAEGLDRWCQTSGASSVLATDEQKAAMEDALASVLEAATAPAEASAAADRVAELGADVPESAGRACEGPVIEATGDLEVTPVGDQRVLDGMWRMDVRKEDLLAAGASSAGAAIDAGVWTLDIRNGLGIVQAPHVDDCTFQFRFDGEHVSIDFGAHGNDACYGLVQGTFRLDGDTVHFTWTEQRDYDVALDNAIWARGLHRIG